MLRPSLSLAFLSQPSLRSLLDSHLLPRNTRFTPPEDTGEVDEYGRRLHLTAVAEWKANKDGPWDDPLLEAARLLTADVDPEFLVMPERVFEEFKAANPGGYEEIYAEDGRRKMRGCCEVMRVLGCVDGPPLSDPEVIDKEVREELETVVRSNVRTGDLREAGRWLRVLGEGVDLKEEVKSNVWWGKGEEEGEWYQILERAGIKL